VKVSTRSDTVTRGWSGERIASLLWLVPAGVSALLLLRFLMRLLGVRYDTPLPGAIYTLTDPMVRPLYRWLPAPERFDLYAVEWASVAVAGVVIAGALALFVAGLLVSRVIPKGRA
jgi:uncharacterized protein YggT (Ycf19 family)